MGFGDWLTKEEVREIIDEQLEEVEGAEGVCENISQLREDIDKLRKNIEKRRDDISKLRRQHKALEAENAALRQRINQLESELPARLEQILINAVNKQFKNK